MFGGRSMMVNDKLVACAMKEGNLLVRVEPARHNALLALPGAAQAELGAGRLMGPGWIAVSREAIASDGQLSFWMGIARDHNRALVKTRRG